jgi:signal transduction histidine kinase
MNAFQVGERQLFTVILRDLTEQKSLQTRLLQAEKLQSIGQLAAGVAHEINTPNQFLGDNIRFLRDSFGELDSLLDACDQLVKQAQDESDGQDRMQQIQTLSQGVEIDYLRREIPNAIEQSLEGVENVARIVGSMKEFSHPGGMGKVSYDLNKAILNTLTVVQSRTKDVAEVITELDVNLPPTACLPNEFNQVILNIVVNAADAIAEHRQGERGEIRVTTHLHGDTVEIRIQDNGGGIPLEHQRRVFDPFFTTKEVGKGTGQGLSIAHSIIVDKHGGEFSLESTPGEGSTFIIRLPIQDEEDVFEEDAPQECEATA